MGSNNKIIVIGASIGGPGALKQIFSGVPAPGFVVLDIDPGESLLPRAPGPTSRMPVQQATDGAAIESGKIYVVLPGHHLVAIAAVAVAVDLR